MLKEKLRIENYHDFSQKTDIIFILKSTLRMVRHTDYALFIRTIFERYSVAIKRYILTLILLFSPWAMAGNFLPTDQAFAFSSQQNDGKLRISWHIEHGYYLYKDRTHVYPGEENEKEVAISFLTDSVIKDDKNFGEVPVFFDNASATVDLNALASSENSRIITVEYQGCAKSGLCYQPQYVELNIAPFTPDKTAAAITAAKTISPADIKITETNELSSTDDIANFLKTAGFWTTVGVFFILGAGLSLTPCILPMVPILSGVIVGHGKQLTALRGLSLSGSYVLGMSATYATVGVLAATLGAKGNLQIYMQNPWAISAFAFVFVVLALSMFGAYTLQLPISWQNRLNNISTHQHSGNYGGVFAMGALAALVASPCVSAPLAGALVYISSTGDSMLGASALFSLGLGMGIPLLALGAGGGKLIPKAGMWMNQVKTVFGVVLLGVAIWLLSRIVAGQITLLLWAGLLIFYGIYTGALDAAEPGIARLRKATSFSLLLYGCILLVGAATGGSDPFAPITLSATTSTTTTNPNGDNSSSALGFRRISSGSELDQALAQASSDGKPVMLDFYANWCTACIDMEESVFSEASVNTALSPYQLLQVDITDNTDEHRALMDRFGLYGPPSVLFFSPNSKELAGVRIQGELSETEFLEHLKNVKKTAALCTDSAAASGAKVC